MEMTVEHRRLRAKAWVRKLPFFDPARKRAGGREGGKAPRGVGP
jgi:hypothetical protein